MESLVLNTVNRSNKDGLRKLWWILWGVHKGLLFLAPITELAWVLHYKARIKERLFKNIPRKPDISQPETHYETLNVVVDSIRDTVMEVLDSTVEELYTIVYNILKENTDLGELLLRQLSNILSELLFNELKENNTKFKFKSYIETNRRYLVTRVSYLISGVLIHVIENTFRFLWERHEMDFSLVRTIRALMTIIRHLINETLSDSLDKDKIVDGYGSWDVINSQLEEETGLKLPDYEEISIILKDVLDTL